MQRSHMLALLAATTAILPASVAAQDRPTPTTPAATSRAAPSPAAARKIANAITAAPRSITDKAAVVDWPASEGAKMVTLREGTNGWTCMPDFPQTEGNDPMCLDDQWMSFIEAQATRTRPNVQRVGIGYMMASGGGWGSNKDPFATGRTADNEWGYDPPHVMVVVPDPRALEGLPTTRQEGAPYVMFAGTPYAHIMVPTATGKNAAEAKPKTRMP